MHTVSLGLRQCYTNINWYMFRSLKTHHQEVQYFKKKTAD